MNPWSKLCAGAITARPQFMTNRPSGFVSECASASASSSPTKILPASSYHAGMRWPHQSWRLTHQSWMFSSHWLYVVAQFSGTNFTAPVRTAFNAGSVIAFFPPGPGLPSTRVSLVRSRNH